LNREDHQDRKEKMLAHLAAEQLDSVMDREEVATRYRTERGRGTNDGVE
jgi:hypothetical protein